MTTVSQGNASGARGGMQDGVDVLLGCLFGDLAIFILEVDHASTIAKLRVLSPQPSSPRLKPCRELSSNMDLTINGHL